MHLLLALLFFIPGCVQAQQPMVVSSGGDRMTLYFSPCESEVKKIARPELQSQLQAGEYYIGQKKETVKGCWLEMNGTVHTVWEDGDYIPVPIEMFKRNKI
jgi:hypothetical protein